MGGGGETPGLEHSSPFNQLYDLIYCLIMITIYRRDQARSQDFQKGGYIHNTFHMVGFYKKL